MAENVTIIGDGAMGTVCALLLCANGHCVRMWSAFPEAAQALRERGENTRFLPGVKLPPQLAITADDAACFHHSTLVVSAVPTQYLRSAWTRLAGSFLPGTPIVSCTKGIEIESKSRPSQVIASVLQARDSGAPLCALSGPNIAGEIARQLPATAVAASADPALAERVQAAFSGQTFRVYTNADVIGVEISGAVKNVIALAAGMVDGLGLGSNAKAALLTRGLVEITRLGVALGAQPATFAGLAGLGDLVTTCINSEGRNRSTGEALGRGEKLAEVLGQRASVVEGVPTTRAVMELAAEVHVEMPITAAVHSILFQNVSPREALTRLMSRSARPETL